MVAHRTLVVITLAMNDLLMVGGRQTLERALGQQHRVLCRANVSKELRSVDIRSGERPHLRPPARLSACPPALLTAHCCYGRACRATAVSLER